MAWGNVFVAVSGVCCGVVVCFGFGDRYQHDINEEFVNELVELMSVVVAIGV